MNTAELLFLAVYVVLAAILCPAFVYWLIDAKKFGGSRLCAVVVGLAFASTWPMSVIAMHFLEKRYQPA